MINQLEMKIAQSAQSYAHMIKEGTDATPRGHERMGKLLGLCMAYKIALGSERAHIGLAHDALERAQVTLGYLDEEGNDIS